MPNVVAKMRFNAIKTFINWENRKVAQLEFTVVQGNTEENKKFFDASPSGTLTLGTVNQGVIDTLDLNTDYYVIVTNEKPPGL